MREPGLAGQIRGQKGQVGTTLKVSKGFCWGLQGNPFKDDYESNMPGSSTTAYSLPGETGLRGPCGHGGSHWSVSSKRERAWGEGNGSQELRENQERKMQKRRLIKGKNGRNYFRNPILFHSLRLFPDCGALSLSLSTQMVWSWLTLIT